MNKILLSILIVILSGCDQVSGSNESKSNDVANISNIQTESESLNQELEPLTEEEIEKILVVLIDKLRVEEFVDDENGSTLKKIFSKENHKNFHEVLSRFPIGLFEFLSNLNAEFSKFEVELSVLRSKQDDLKNELQNLKIESDRIIKNSLLRGFESSRIVLVKKFDQDAAGYSYFESFDFNKMRKVVVKIKREIDVQVGVQNNFYAKDLGDFPFTVVNSNQFRSFETKEYLHVLEIDGEIHGEIRDKINNIENSMRVVNGSINVLKENFYSIVKRSVLVKSDLIRSISKKVKVNVQKTTLQTLNGMYIKNEFSKVNGASDPYEVVRLPIVKSTINNYTKGKFDAFHNKMQAASVEVNDERYLVMSGGEEGLSKSNNAILVFNKEDIILEIGIFSNGNIINVYTSGDEANLSAHMNYWVERNIKDVLLH